jgi:thiamine-phosphate pyrophosphorylase
VYQVEQAILGGASLVQYRDKGSDAQRRRLEAESLLVLCRRHGVPFLINDDVALAAHIRADGVHLGRDDMPLRQARRLLGESAIIGVSCYDRLERFEAAVAGGADYAAFGSFFPSNTKPKAVQATPDLLRRAKARSRLRLVAIGGITPQNGGPLISAGADMLAVIDAVFGRPDIRLACRAFAPIFTQEDSP